MKSRSDMTPGLRKGASILGMAVLAVMVATAPAMGAQAKTKRMSIHSNGAQANGASFEAAVNWDGRYIAFSSKATNLVSGARNRVQHCYVRDAKAKKTTRVSVSSEEVLGNGSCYGADISASGRYVVFESQASNLVPGDGNNTWDIFVRDRTAGTTEIVSVNKFGDVGNGLSKDPAISGDGRYVVFESWSTNLVPVDTNGKEDVFLHDRKTGETTLVSVHKNGSQGKASSFDPEISADGKFVVFVSDAKNLVNGGTNKWRHVFVHEIATGRTSLVSRRSNGPQGKKGNSGNPTISSNGRFIAFDSEAKNLVNNDTNRAKDVFVHDLKKKTTKRVSVRSGGRQVTGWSYDPTISDNGRLIVFTSSSVQLVRGDTNKKADVFVHDRTKRTTKRLSVRTGGAQAKGGGSRAAKLSGDRKVVVFDSAAKNLISNDGNGTWDVFRRGPLY